VPKAKQLNAERSAARVPDAYSEDITNNILDEAIVRLGAIDQEHPWWKSALNDLGGAVIRPEWFKKPYVQKWLSQTDVQRFLKQLARVSVIGGNVAHDTYEALIATYIETSLEDRQHAESVISTAIAVLQASITGAVRDPGTAAIVQAASAEQLELLGVISTTLKSIAPVALNQKTDWAQHPDASYLALAVLAGSWQDKNKHDLEVITQLLGISYETWLKKAKEILHYPDSPLTLKNGIWKVVGRAELWSLLGSRIFDQNVDTFRSLAITVLKESDPVFELPVEERFAASLYGKVLNYSHALRQGLAEGLAIISTQPDACSNCSFGKAEVTCLLVIRELLTDSDWVLWGSLNGLLPVLAEASPGEFLAAVERGIRLTPCPFDALFFQESSGTSGNNYLTGLFWALEGLAWDEQYLVRACVVLGELATHDPGGQWGNRPSSSLATILLPWLPQTLASVDKRKVAMRALLDECPDIAWDLIIRLLPDQHQISSGSHKPVWRKVIPDTWEKGVTDTEYNEQSSFYAELAVAVAGRDIVRLSTLIDRFGNLTQHAFDQLIHVLASLASSVLPEEDRLAIWDHLMKFTNKHRRFADAEWALPDALIIRIEQTAGQFTPTTPFHFYQHLFADAASDMYEESGDWKEQESNLNMRRETAISEIFQQYGTEGVIQFAISVSSPDQVGYALVAIDESVVEQTLLPNILTAEDNKLRTLVNSFIWRSCHVKGWKWCDDVDKSGWAPEQIGQFLAYLPFIKEAWDRASVWLEQHEKEYWVRTSANAYQANGDLAIAIEKLIEYGRPLSAINCLANMRHSRQPVDTQQCIRALLAALSPSEPQHTLNSYNAVELIKFLQGESAVNQAALANIEWAYLPLLGRNKRAAPKTLENRLANDPGFFCEIIRLIYNSNNEDQPPKELTEDAKAIATNASRLLDEWKTPPGTQKDGTFSEKDFTDWLQDVKSSCTVSGHLSGALTNIGEVLIHTSPDPDGLWIRHVVAVALNERNSDEMRDGFSRAAYNSRGVHWVDPTGNPERILAEQFRSKAEDVENAGCQRFAVTLKSIADEYDREATRIINNHKGQDNN